MVQALELKTAGAVRVAVAWEDIEHFLVEVPVTAIVEPPRYQSGRSLSDVIAEQGLALVFGDGIPSQLRFPKYVVLGKMKLEESEVYAPPLESAEFEAEPHCRFGEKVYAHSVEDLGWGAEQIYWRFKDGERLTLVMDVERINEHSRFIPPPARVTVYLGRGALRLSGGKDYGIAVAYGYYPGYDGKYAKCLYPDIPLFSERRLLDALPAASPERRALVKA